MLSFSNGPQHPAAKQYEKEFPGASLGVQESVEDGRTASKTFVRIEVTISNETWDAFCDDDDRVLYRSRGRPERENGKRMWCGLFHARGYYGSTAQAATARSPCLLGLQDHKVRRSILYAITW